MQSLFISIIFSPCKGGVNLQNKKLYLAVEISQLLVNQKCTYSETESILSLLIDEFKQQREELEYSTIDDYFNNQKCCNADRQVIKPLNHVDGYF